MSKLKQTKIPVTMNENGELQLDELLLIQGKPNWKLVRERDGLTKHSFNVKWIEWNEDGTFKTKYDKPAQGRSLIMSPFNQYYTWMTTTITEIVEEKDDYIKFKTLNSVYELFKINNG